VTAAKPYDLQRLYEEKAGGPFEFTWADQTWSMPNMRMLDIATQDRIENLEVSGSGVETINELFDDLMGTEQGQRWRAVVRPLPMILDLFQAWLEHSKQAMGEQPASAGSSKSTGRPSKRTSNSSSASGSPKPSSRRARKTATPPVSS
jgi:hypothetical protein